MSKTRTVKSIDAVVRAFEGLYFYIIFEDGETVQAQLRYPVLRLTTFFDDKLDYVREIERIVLFGETFRFVRQVTRYYTMPISGRAKLLVHHDFYYLAERLSRPVRNFYEKLINDITDRCDHIFGLMYCLREPVTDIFEKLRE